MPKTEQITIKRTLLEELKEHLSKKEISFIIGPRQAGKTTLMFLLKSYLESRKERTVFLSLDFERDKQFFASQDKLIQKIQLEIGKERGYVFIDELQRKENAGLFMKGLYDMGLPYKFIVSGSGTVELKEKIHESLIGRKRVFELNTLSFEEFVNFRTDYNYQQKLLDFFALDKERGGRLLDEYLNFGGYPRVVLEEKAIEKNKIIDEIYQSYLERDIFYFLAVQKTEAFTQLVKIMASQTGNLVNFFELSSTLGIAAPTLKHYLWYLQKTFILQKITPYFENLRKEITKTPVFYFYDLGLKNYSSGEFGKATTSSGAGFLFENFVFNILKEKVARTSAKIHFWRTKDGAEVDFVISLGRRVIPLEVKYQKIKKPVISRSLRSFLVKYKPALALVVNLELEKEISFKQTKISFIPYYKVPSIIIGG